MTDTLAKISTYFSRLDEELIDNKALLRHPRCIDAAVEGGFQVSKQDDLYAGGGRRRVSLLRTRRAAAARAADSRPTLDVRCAVLVGRIQEIP